MKWCVVHVIKKRKQVKVQHKKVPNIQSKATLDMIHIKLMGPMQTKRIRGKKYVFVIVYDYLRFVWIRFIRKSHIQHETSKYGPYS